jgi:hypothetical protein
LTWQPEQFTGEQRYAAAKAVVRAQTLIDRLDCAEFGSENEALVKQPRKKFIESVG